MRTAGQGQHTKGKAQDWQIIDPQGNPVANRGSDASGLYTLLAQNAYGYQEKNYPELTGAFQWGGQFGTSARNPNEPDLMHFDIGGRRGRIKQYSRENIGAALPPVSIANRPRDHQPDITAAERHSKAMVAELQHSNRMSRERLHYLRQQRFLGPTLLPSAADDTMAYA